MTAAPHNPLVERVARNYAAVYYRDYRHKDECVDKHWKCFAPAAEAAIAACHAEEIMETLRWYASDDAYRTEGQPGDTVYDRMRRPERIQQDRGQRARALLAKLDGRP